MTSNEIGIASHTSYGTHGHRWPSKQESHQPGCQRCLDMAIKLSLFRHYARWIKNNQAGQIIGKVAMADDALTQKWIHNGTDSVAVTLESAQSDTSEMDAIDSKP